MATYMCPCCYKIYKSSSLRVLHSKDGIPHYLCPSISCAHSGTDLVELDDPIAKYISQLNELGYRTKACCSGHNYDYYLDIYILFVREYKFDYLPEDWEYDNRDKKIIRCKENGRHLISTNIDIIIGQAMYSLDKWIKRMEDDLYGR